MKQKIRIGILGGGASGSLVLIHLAQQLQKMKNPPEVEVELFEKEPRRTWRGIAYSTGEKAETAGYTLNVPAKNMSAFQDQPADFYNWLQATAKTFDQEAFAPRRLFGQYLEERAAAALKSAPIVLHKHGSAAEDILRTPEGKWCISSSGKKHDVDRIVFATGNLPPKPLRGVTEKARRHPRYFEQPWEIYNGRWDDNASVLFIGAGLSMLDAAGSLAARGHRGHVVAISRKGLLPSPHGRSNVPYSLPPEVQKAGLRSLTRTLRAEIDSYEERGGSFQDVIESLRPWTVPLWRSWNTEEQRRFLRHAKSFWEVIRHRAPPEQLQRLKQLNAETRAARISWIDHDEKRFIVHFDQRTGATTEHFDVVVNATGPSGDFRAFEEAGPYSTLLKSGEIAACPHGFGFKMDEKLNVLDSESRPQPDIFALGSLTKGSFWEVTSVPDIRQQAALIAAGLLK